MESALLEFAKPELRAKVVCVGVHRALLLGGPLLNINDMS